MNTEYDKNILDRNLIDLMEEGNQKTSSNGNQDLRTDTKISTQNISHRMSLGGVNLPDSRQSMNSSTVINTDDRKDMGGTNHLRYSSQMVYSDYSEERNKLQYFKRRNERHLAKA